MKKEIRKEYDRWLKNALLDEEVVRELKEMQRDEKKAEEAFFTELSFGTGGLRGILGAGTNRMNVYTVAKATQGVAEYINQTFAEKERKVVLGYDSRKNSYRFACVAAEVLAGNGLVAYLYPQITPTPCVSFAVRSLGCCAGIMITASHNPATYNGYKVYDKNGCQITESAAKEIYERIKATDCFAGVKRKCFSEGMAKDCIRYVPNEVFDAYIEAVKTQTVNGEVEADKSISIVYSPLNGTGLLPVLRVLKETGYQNVTVVREQSFPDQNFSTCPYPNPEEASAMELGIRYAQSLQADLFLATDPDCDRVGLVVKNENGEYVRLSGNETGVLLLDYICSRLKERGCLPKDGRLIKSIVTTDMGERIARFYGLQTQNVLTGFKYIGEKIGEWEKAGRAESFVFGFEESCGYLRGSYVRDKDGVLGVLLVCEMAAYYAAKKISLAQKMWELYEKYGYTLNSLYAYQGKDSSDLEKIHAAMDKLRTGEFAFFEPDSVKKIDYLLGYDGFPKSDVLKFVIDGKHSVIVRPSGTEPKLKIYLSVCENTKDKANQIELVFQRKIREFIKTI